MLSDCIAEGIPLDSESIAAGILAEVVSSGSLCTSVIEAQLGPGVAKLLHDVMRVRALPKRLDIYDDVATRWLFCLLLAWHDICFQINGHHTSFGIVAVCGILADPDLRL